MPLDPTEVTGIIQCFGGRGYYTAHGWRANGARDALLSHSPTCHRPMSRRARHSKHGFHVPTKPFQTPPSAVSYPVRMPTQPPSTHMTLDACDEPRNFSVVCRLRFRLIWLYLPGCRKPREWSGSEASPSGPLFRAAAGYSCTVHFYRAQDRKLLTVSLL